MIVPESSERQPAGGIDARQPAGGIESTTERGDATQEEKNQVPPGSLSIRHTPQPKGGKPEGAKGKNKGKGGAKGKDNSGGGGHIGQHKEGGKLENAHEESTEIPNDSSNEESTAGRYAALHGTEEEPFLENFDNFEDADVPAVETLAVETRDQQKNRSMFLLVGFVCFCWLENGPAKK